MSANEFKEKSPRYCGLLATLAAMVFYASPTVAVPLINQNIPNRTGLHVDDFHYRLTSANNIIVTEAQTYPVGYPAGAPPMPIALISNNNSQDVTINFSGAVVDPDLFEHFGITYSSVSQVTIVESWWTVGGLKAGTVPQPTVVDKHNAGPTDHQIVQINMFDDISGTTSLGTSWYEQLGVGSPVIENFSSTPFYVSYAFFNTPTLVPLDQLNFFGLPEFQDLQFSAIQLLAPISTTPEPTSLSLVFIGIAVLRLARLKADRRRRLAPGLR